MSLRAKVFSLFAFTGVAAFANLLTFSLTGPDVGITQGGGPCTGSNLPCIVGGASTYEIYSLTLQELSNGASGSTWGLDVQTNYPAPGPPTSPIFTSGSNSWLQDVTDPGFAGNSFDANPGLFNMGDLLIFNSSYSNPVVGGVVLSDHIFGTAPGTLILNSTAIANSAFLQTSCFALTGNTTCGPSGSYRLDGVDPVWLLNNPNVNTNTASGEIAFLNSSVPSGLPSYCTAGTQATFTVCDTFSAPQNFLSTGTPLFDLTSFVCDNGDINGSGATGGVPEPRSLFLLIPGLLLAAHFVRRRYRLTA